MNTGHNPQSSGVSGPTFDLGAWRSEIPILESYIPLNNCSHAPQTRATLAAAEEYLSSWNRDGMNWEVWMAEVEAARAAFARLINASPDEVAVTTSVSAATASIASALDFTGSRNRIVASGAEFPTVGHVFLSHCKYGAEVEWVRVSEGIIDAAAFEPMIDEKTALVSACHAYYQNGFKLDIEAIGEIARGNGALMYVDAYQTLGTCPIDVKKLDVDLLSCGSQKYLMGVPGIAFLYVRHDLIESLRPAVTGWFGRRNPFAFEAQRLDWSSTARRFDTGTPPVFNVYVARAGMEMIESLGPAAIHDWTQALSTRLMAGGLERGLTVHGVQDVTKKTPSTAFVCTGDTHSVEVRLRAKGILSSARGPVIRLAPHFYNTLDEMDTALDALTDILQV